MKPENVIPGRKYGHSDYPNIVYFGFEDIDNRKKGLVIISGYICVGNTVKCNSEDSEEFWQGFFELDCQ